MSRPALAADRAVTVIDLLLEHAGRRFTMSEISRNTGVNMASLHALLAVLERRGYVAREPAHRTYGLGPALIAAGAVSLARLPAIREALDALDSLSHQLALEVVLSVATGPEILVVGRAGHSSAFGDALRVGQRLPLSPPLGAAFLAWSPAAEVERWLERAHPPLTDDERAQQLRALEVVRARGYAIGLDSAANRSFGTAITLEPDAATDRVEVGDRLEALLSQLAQSRYQLESVDEGQTYDVATVSAPIFDAHARVIAAVAASGFPPEQAATQLRRVAEEVRGFAAVITKRTDGRVPDATVESS